MSTTKLDKNTTQTVKILLTFSPGVNTELRLSNMDYWSEVSTDSLHLKA
jgi:hypothetical protein